MTSAARKIYEEALRLPPEERVQLTVDLLSSLEPGLEDNVEPAWVAEVEHRVRTSDPADDVSWEDVRRELRDSRA
jgi:putative addiction module component (TIGR02574 family)